MLDRMANIVRESWKELPGLKPLKVSKKYQSIYKEVEGESLVIQNEMYKCKGLRKIHLEVAHLGALDILHCVWFPDPAYNLPIFGADIVANKSIVSAAIVDLSPVDGWSPVYADIAQLSTKYKFSKDRKIPQWGSIFSPYCKFMSLEEPEEKELFLDLVENYLKALCKYVNTAEPQSETFSSVKMRHYGQVNYCKQQKKNDKTRRILAKCFNNRWADKYIDNVLFNEPRDKYKKDIE